jgi:hypothetical protein
MKRILASFVIIAAAAVSAFASVDTGLLALIPANSKVVAGIDVQKCRSSEFGQYLLSRSQANDAHFDQFMTQTGFDPRRDLESLILTTSEDVGGSTHSSFAILARGNFDQAKIRSLALTKGAVSDIYQGVNLLVHKDHGQTVAVAFPDTGVAVMGDLDSIHQVIQNLSTPAPLDVDLSNRIDAAGNANDAWFVSATGGASLGKRFGAQTGGQMAGQAQALQSIRAASGGVVFGSTIAVTLDAATRSEQDATSLADVFRFGASMVQMQRQQDPRAGIMAASLDNMQLKTNGDSVHVGFSMSEKNLEQIADLGPQVKH